MNKLGENVFGFPMVVSVAECSDVQWLAVFSVKKMLSNPSRLEWSAKSFDSVDMNIAVGLFIQLLNHTPSNIFVCCVIRSVFITDSHRVIGADRVHDKV